MRTMAMESTPGRQPGPPRCSPAANPGAARRAFLAGGVSAGVAIILGVGCASPQRTAAKKLLEAVAKSNRRQSTAMKRFTDIVSSHLQESGATTADDVATGLQKLKAETAAIREEASSWPVPETTEAESLLIACRRVFQEREKLLEGFEAPFLDTLRNQVLPPQQKVQKATRMFESMTGVDGGLVLDLRRAQRAYAGAMGVFSYE